MKCVWKYRTFSLMLMEWYRYDKISRGKLTSVGAATGAVAGLVGTTLDLSRP